MYGNAEGDRLYFTDEMLRILVKICFCQNDDRRQAAVVDQGQVPLYAAQVKIPVKTGNDKYGIKVCGNDLFLLRLCILFVMGA